MFQRCNKMVKVCFVIEKNPDSMKYISRFVEVFGSVRASPFTKKPLLNEFKHKTKVFSDRLVFYYEGVVEAFSLMVVLLKYSIIALSFVFGFLIFNGMSQGLINAAGIVLLVGVLILAVYYFVISKYGFWNNHLKTFKKKKFNLGNTKKRLLKDYEISDCFDNDVMPLFKRKRG